jgi:RNase P subunit RPR2
VQFDAKPVNIAPAAVIQEAKIQGLCYKCKEPWFPGHKKVCKLATKNQVLALQASQPDHRDIIYITEGSDSEDENENPPQELHLNMHTVWGLKSCHHTFTVTLTMGLHNATTLIDTGSTATFLTPSFATKAQCPLLPTKKMRVTVANGETLWTEFACFNCKYTIQGIPFTSDFNIL